MYNTYFQHLNKKITLTRAEEELIKSRLIVKKLRKKQYLLQEGDICKYTAFVEKGILRSYTVDGNGGEHIAQFAMEGWFIADLYSFFSGEPAIYNIDAVEDAELVLMTKSANDMLLQQCPKYQTLMLELITNAYIALQRRLNAIPHLTVDERYQKLVQQYPVLVNRVPQHMIASYLGITPETLSRVRKRIANNT
ncbi:Crp/Fnr family transcriptional regulator [Hydrotalea sp.]|uniref:Crp/Fnr family transcriptional regulator n=1 Tax=Hydrotalea sp. TaxID=2881279 RepID=UPI0026051721|nr:Crp/Fnr family transcriptional regulator [Hydrotalea sp.]